MLICKAGATSIKWTLLNTLGLNGAEQLQWRSKKYVLEFCSDYYKVAFTRHPIDRIASCWRQKVNLRKGVHRTFPDYGIYCNMPFPDFVQLVATIPDSRADKHFRSQVWDLTENGTLLPCFVGRVENMQTDWERLQETIADRLELLPIGWRNRCGGSVTWDDETLRIARERYADDLRVFYNE
jgi:hypothetical protein